MTKLDSAPESSRQDGHLKPSQVFLGAAKNVAEIIKTASSDPTSSNVSLKKMSPTALVVPCEDMTKVDLSSLPLDLDITVDNRHRHGCNTRTLPGHQGRWESPPAAVPFAGFCKWQKTKVHPTSDKQEPWAVMMQSITSLSPRAMPSTGSVPSTKLNSTPLELCRG